MEYKVLQMIWHTADDSYYAPGAVVKMDHLLPEVVDSLVRRGVIAPIEKSKNKPEVKHGSNDGPEVDGSIDFGI